MVRRVGKKKVVVGMSGGVDSSVSALLLKEQGYEVIGLYMKNWKTAMAAVRERPITKMSCESAILLKIPCYTINFVQEYKDSVFSHFIEELKLGYTPNPDVLCNRKSNSRRFFKKLKSSELIF